MSELMKFGVCSVNVRSHYGNDTYYLSDEVDARLALMQRAIDWCLENTPYRTHLGRLYSREVPAEFAEFIRSKP